MQDCRRNGQEEQVHGGNIWIAFGFLTVEAENLHVLKKQNDIQFVFFFFFFEENP